MNSNLAQTLSSSLVEWYEDNKRDLPWRHTKDPYLIWLSEIILQQTTVAQGLNYYQKFAQHYPTVFDLAKADIDEVLKLWQGLGYYSRARNLHTTANTIVSNYNGIFPESYEEVLKLKGVGPYTAAAIVSFAYNMSIPVVDGNVIRFISRYFGIRQASDLPSTIKEIRNLCGKLIIHQQAEVFNQAIMEIGATVCKPKNPQCQNCPFSDSCYSNENNAWKVIPFKSKKLVKRKRYFYFLHIIDPKDKSYIEKRSAKDIWQGLYQFPLAESPSIIENPIELFEGLIKPYEFDILGYSKTFKQQLTHQTIMSQFIKIKTKQPLKGSPDYILVKQPELNKYAWPKTIDLYFSDLSITLF